MNRLRTILFFLTLLVFAIWFGGLTFYAGVVVPIGTDILGSARAQGEVTQQVTFWLNWIGTVAITMLLIDHFIRARKIAKTDERRSIVKRRILLLVLAAMALVQIGLFVVHAQLGDRISRIDGLLRIQDRAGFYSLHQVYLWITILHWIGGLVWLSGIAREVMDSSLNLANETGTDRAS